VYLHKFSFGLIKFSFSKLNLVFLSNYWYCKFIETNSINYLPFKAAERSIKCLKFFDQFQANVRNCTAKK